MMIQNPKLRVVLDNAFEEISNETKDLKGSLMGTFGAKTLELSTNPPKSDEFLPGFKKN